MKILMTDSHNDRLLANFYSKHLRELPNLKIGSLFYTDILENEINSLYKKIIFKLKPLSFLKPVNRDIVKQIEKFRPDIMWIFKGMEIFPETIHYAKERGILLVNYNPDHPFLFQSSGSGNDFVKDSIPMYDLHLSYSREILKELRRVYQIEGKYLPFGYEISDSIYESAQNKPEILRGCFVGVADEERIRMVKLLLRNNIPFDVYGPGWTKHLKSSPQSNVYEGVYTDELWNILRRYRFQLNVFREQNYNAHNMRSFEVPAIGGVMLAPYSDEQVGFFEPDNEAFYFKSDEEMISKANSLISMDIDKIIATRLAARSRVVNSGYSYRERCQLVNIYFKELVQKSLVVK